MESSTVAVAEYGAYNKLSLDQSPGGAHELRASSPREGYRVIRKEISTQLCEYVTLTIEHKLGRCSATLRTPNCAVGSSIPASHLAPILVGVNSSRPI